MSNEVYENEAHKMKIGYIVCEIKAFFFSNNPPLVSTPDIVLK
jgi:hypothetical protein